jgi:thiosulfate dehydrogenase
LVGDAVQGGLLYDKWWKVLGLDEPAGDNPVWARQATNERSGGDTWRCKECHGWDYQGADGAYASGSHFTGFPGLFGSSLGVEALVAQIGGETDPDHDFSAMGDQAMADLAALISGALEDYGQFIAEDKAVAGDLANGEALFASTCVACHGADGTQINFHDADDPTFVGTIAWDNPWEFMHKVRFGQPGTPMPSANANGWSLQDVVDVVAYSQTLPTGG